MDRYELRRLDYTLSEDHTDLQSAYRQFFKAYCSLDTARAAEPTGFDKSLWERLCASGATSMAVPESHGGDGATLVDLTLVAEEVGRVIAPVPWIDHVCATRLLARLDALPSNEEHTLALIGGGLIAGLDPHLGGPSGVRLIPSGSIADDIIVCDGRAVHRLTFDTRCSKVDNLGKLPMAWVDPAAADSRSVLARPRVNGELSTGTR